MVHLDRSANAIALGPDLFEEARRAFEAGRQLLGDSVNLTQLEALIRRGEAVQQTPPWPVIARMVGLITDVTPIGRSTFTARAAGRKLVVKQMTYDRDPDRCMELLIRLSQMPSPFCPRPLGAVVENGRSWYALFEWVNGERPAPADQDEVVWHSALTLLRRMWACEVVPQWRLESIWLDRLGEYLSDERAAAFVLRSLRRTIPEGGSTLAHGDFSHQNFIRDSGGIVLVDWEEIGSAAPGFDAGWMLARARLGVGMRSHQEVFGALIAAGFCESNLVWFERLGLLRLLFHARTLPMNACLRRRVLTAVRGAVSECVVVMKSRSTQWELSAQ